MKVKKERPAEPTGGGSYFASPKTDIEFIKSGCTTLDLVLGGGWAEGRISNIVGDKSSGKTLIAIEASANFILKYPKGRVLYKECEAAFDPKYAAALGMPMDNVDFGTPLETVEDLFNDLTKAVQTKKPTLYIVDSLDALSDKAEMDRDMDQGSYGAEKAKKLSQLFRRLVQRMADSQLTLLIISQVRSKIGISFGRSTTRSGGRALDFYCSQVVYLQHIGTQSKVISAIKRPVALDIKVKCDKNKVSLPLRETVFSIKFGFGIDDLAACVGFLKEAKSLDRLNIHDKQATDFIKGAADLDDENYFKLLAKVHRVTRERWYEIERRFLPKRSKYGA